MAISPELSAKIQTAYNAFTDTINKRGERFVNSQANCDAMKDFMTQAQIPVESWGLAHVWVSVWAQADAQGILPDIPEAAKTVAQVLGEERAANIRREQADRRPGLHGGFLTEEERAEKAKGDLKFLEATIKGKADELMSSVNKETPREKTAYQCKVALGEGPFEYQHVREWFDTWDAKLIRLVRKANPEIAARVDAVVEGRSDPGPSNG